MTSNTKKGILSGPGIPGPQASRSTRSVTNPPASINSPSTARTAKAGPSTVPDQPESDADQTLRIEGESITPVLDKPTTRSPPHSLCSPRSSHSRRLTNPPLADIGRTITHHNRKGKDREQHLFHGIPHLKHAYAYEETLSESMTRCHHPWDPMDEEDDPLLEYGADDGKLPGLTLEQTMPIRDIILRWTAPHQFMVWKSLEDYTNILCPSEETSVQLRVLEAETYYSLNTTLLLHVYEVDLGISQILEAIDLLLTSPYHSLSYNWGLALEGDVHSTT